MRSDLLAIVRAGISAADAEALTRRALGAIASNFTHRRSVALVAAGKAAPAMARAALAVLGERVDGGLIVAPARSSIPPLTSYVGGHPVPTDESEAAGRDALRIAGDVARRSDSMLLVLLSGGASALMAVPADGISLDDKRQTTARLLRGGADIHALNTVRKHLSSIKGGRLAASARVSIALAISDVVGDDPSVIASGPTVPDLSTYADALNVLERYGGLSAYPDAVVRLLRAGVDGTIEETPKPGDRRLAEAKTTIIGGRGDAMNGAAEEAARRGYSVLVISEPVVGEARATAVAHIGAMAARADTLARPACIVSSGETTVHVTGNGRGGRNQEFAVAAAPVLPSGPPSAAASVGTDGVDGPTDAAGGLCDTSTIARARAAGLDPGRYLDDNNTYAFLQALGDLIHTGPTGTNVGDLQLLLLS